MVALCAALFFAGCNSAKAQAPQLLSPLGGKQDNLLIGELESRHPGTLCSLVSADGQARLMSYGNEAVVDLAGVPTLLSYHPDDDGHGAEFIGKAVRISGKLLREPVTDPSRTDSHDVSVEVETRGRAEHLQATWTCQAALITVR